MYTCVHTYLRFPEPETVNVGEEVRERVPLGRQLLHLRKGGRAHIPAARDAAEQPVRHVERAGLVKTKIKIVKTTTTTTGEEPLLFLSNFDYISTGT